MMRWIRASLVALVGILVLTNAVLANDRRVVVRRASNCGLGVQHYQAPAVVVAQQHYQAAYVAPIGYNAFPFQWNYRVGADRIGEERLKKLEELIELQTLTLKRVTDGVVGQRASGEVTQEELAARRVFTSDCLGCHSKGKAKEAMDLTKPDLNVFEIALISQTVSEGLMPPKAKLDQGKISAINSWAGLHSDTFKDELRRAARGGSENTQRERLTAPTPARPE